MKKTIYLFCYLYLLVGCTKKETAVAPIAAPTATFNASGGSYGRYDFLASATNADSYEWNFGDGSSSSDLTPSHGYQSNAVFNVKLIARGKGGVTTFMRSVNVTDVRGNAIFWMKSGSYPVDVTINGDVNTITKNFSAQPTNCVTEGTATFILLTEGTHSFSAKEKGRLFPNTWNGTVTVTGGQCKSMQLTL